MSFVHFSIAHLELLLLYKYSFVTWFLTLPCSLIEIFYFHLDRSNNITPTGFCLFLWSHMANPSTSQGHRDILWHFFFSIWFCSYLVTLFQGIYPFKLLLVYLLGSMPVPSCYFNYGFVLCLKVAGQVAQSLKHLTLDLSSGHDLTVQEFKPHIRLCVVGAEPASIPSLFLYLPLPCWYSQSLSK